MTNTLDFVPYVRRHTVRITLNVRGQYTQTKNCLRPILKARRSFTLSQQRIETKFCLRQRRSSAFVRGAALSSPTSKFCSSPTSKYSTLDFLLDRRRSLRRVFAGYLHWILVKPSLHPDSRSSWVIRLLPAREPPNPMKEMCKESNLLTDGRIS